VWCSPYSALTGDAQCKLTIKNTVKIPRLSSNRDVLGRPSSRQSFMYLRTRTSKISTIQRSLHGLLSCNEQVINQSQTFPLRLNRLTENTVSPPHPHSLRWRHYKTFICRDTVQVYKNNYREGAVRSAGPLTQDFSNESPLMQHNVACFPLPLLKMAATWMLYSQLKHNTNWFKQSAL